jgi:hypothetical protein
VSSYFEDRISETSNDDFSDTDDDWSGLSDESFNDN